MCTKLQIRFKFNKGIDNRNKSVFLPGREIMEQIIKKFTFVNVPQNTILMYILCLFILNSCNIRFCYMEPFKGKCAYVEQKPKPGIVVVSTKRSRDDCVLKDSESKKIEAGTNASGSGQT